ncbi:hypothetical protein QAD02_022949 [Eretmocerus hayati]|uniref:Uncharacterized protein n=1 Tax=Eretmocerus hayati TaxID=131215 RepID=A0ACC2PUP4_9HYME|nr:hypothetical protein QAD02_022949 [Eretmocerus hayati]
MPKLFPDRPVIFWVAFATICISKTNAEIAIFSRTDILRPPKTFPDLPARFGGIIPDEGIKGVVVYADPPYACQDIKAPPVSPDYDGYNWIVLISRGNCTFEAKIRNAQKAQYQAAIVHNINSDDLEQMSANDAGDILIPAVFVGGFTGYSIKESFLYDSDYFIVINDLPLNINTHLLLPFAIVVGICFLVMVTFMIVRCVQDRRRARRHRLPNSSLKKIPIHKYTKGDPYETCAICLEDYIENEKLRVLPCAHAYHTKCIDPWLTKNRRVCPVCKRKVFAADERVETDSESDSDADDSTPLIRNSAGPGTQGGTFETQRENPFWAGLRRARREQRERRYSGSSFDSAEHPILERPPRHHEHDDEDDEDDDFENVQSLRVQVEALQRAADEVTDFERSVSSTRPHTVNLSSDVTDKNSIVGIIDPSTGRHARPSQYEVDAQHARSGTVLPVLSDDTVI